MIWALADFIARNGPVAGAGFSQGGLEEDREVAIEYARENARAGLRIAGVTPWQEAP